MPMIGLPERQLLEGDAVVQVALEIERGHAGIVRIVEPGLRAQLLRHGFRLPPALWYPLGGSSMSADCADASDRILDGNRSRVGRMRAVSLVAHPLVNAGRRWPIARGAVRAYRQATTFGVGTDDEDHSRRDHRRRRSSPRQPKRHSRASTRSGWLSRSRSWFRPPIGAPIFSRPVRSCTATSISAPIRIPSFVPSCCAISVPISAETTERQASYSAAFAWSRGMNSSLSIRLPSMSITSAFQAPISNVSPSTGMRASRSSASPAAV